MVLRSGPLMRADHVTLRLGVVLATALLFGQLMHLCHLLIVIRL